MGYFDTAGRDDVLAGGIRMVPITTPSGPHRVWTKRTGNNPATKMLLLHGGPGATHEYALAHQEHLKGLVISNMMASIPAYNAYANDVLIPAQDPATIDEIKALEAAGDTDNPRYDELLMREHYVKRVLRLPLEDWPEPVVRSFSRINKSIYVPLQGPSELGASGLLSDWDRVADLDRIEVPALVIGAAHDTMDASHLKDMADRLPQGSYLHCPDGSHLAMYDDQETYMRGLVDWVVANG